MKDSNEAGESTGRDIKDLKVRVISSLAWLSGAKLAAQIITWTVTLKVIALLDPADYGLLSLALVSINFLLVFKELGLGAALIQKADLDQRTIQRVLGAVVLANFFFFGAAYFLAPVVAAFFDNERLVDLIRVLSIQFPLMSLTVVPVSLLTRAIALKKIALIDLVAQLTNSAVSLGLALSGYGVWSLVYGSLAAMIVKAVGLNLVAPFFKLPRFDLKGMGVLASFSANVMAARVMFSFFSQLDVMIAGKTLDQNNLGLYSVSGYIANMPMYKLLGIVNQVGFPAFSTVQKRPDLIGYYFLKSLRLISIVSVPVLWGMSAITPEIVHVLFDEKWQGVELTLQILALVVPLRLVNQLTAPMLFGTNRPGTVTTNFMIMAVIMGLALVIGSQWMAFGMALTWLLVFPFAALFVLVRSIRELEIGIADILGAIWRPFAAGAIMYCAIYLLRPAFSQQISQEWLLLVALMLTGALAYSAAIFYLARPALEELRSLRRPRTDRLPDSIKGGE